MVGEVQATAASASAATAGDRIQRDLGKDAFLRLLVTQLNYQDPLSPMQNEAFVAQLAQFSSLEQMQQINRNLEDSINADFLLNKSMNNSLVTTLIGKDVVAAADEVTLSDDQLPQFGFELPSPSGDVRVEIYDSNGKLVRTLDLGSRAAGRHFIQWDGKDQHGQPLEAGKYSFKVTARGGEEGEDLSVTTFIRGTISGVRYDDGVARLLIGKLELGLGDVLQIMQPQG